MFNTREGKPTSTSASTSAAPSGTVTPIEVSEQVRRQEEAKAAKAARKVAAEANKVANDARREQAKREQEDRAVGDSSNGLTQGVAGLQVDKS